MAKEGAEEMVFGEEKNSTAVSQLYIMTRTEQRASQRGQGRDASETNAAKAGAYHVHAMLKLSVKADVTIPIRIISFHSLPTLALEGAHSEVITPI